MCDVVRCESLGAGGGGSSSNSSSSPNSVFNTWGSYGSSKRPGG